MNDGWIKLYRSFLDWEWYTDANVMRVFLHLLLIANHEERRWMGIQIKRGQTVTSYDSLSSSLGLSIRQIRTVLSKLEKTGEICKKTTNKYTLITICNFDFYQSNEQAERQTSDKQVTSERQTSDNKQECKELKNNNNPPLTCACEEKTEEKPQGEQPSPFETYELIKQKEKLKKEIGYTDEQKDSEIEQFKQQLLGSEQDLMGLMKTCGITLPEAKDYIEKHSEQVKFDKKVYYNYADYRSHVGNMYSKYKEKHKRATQYDPRRGQEPAKNFEDSL